MPPLATAVKNVPRTALPPSFGRILSDGPPPSVSPRPPLVVIAISRAFATSAMYDDTPAPLKAEPTLRPSTLTRPSLDRPPNPPKTTMPGTTWTSVGAPALVDAVRNQLDQVVVRARGRNRADHVVVEDHLPPHVLDVDDGRLPGHGDGLGERADAQVGVDRRGEGPFKGDTLPLDGGESRQCERDHVLAGPQIDDAVLAVAVGRRGPHLFDQRRAGRFDRHSRQNGPRGVLDDAGDRRLRPGDRRKGQDGEQHDSGHFQRAHTSIPPEPRDPTRARQW